MKMILAFICATVFASFCDGIDHGKGDRVLYDLWHLTRDIMRYSVFLPGYWFTFELPWYVYLTMILFGWFLWEFLYKIFYARGPAWDDAFYMPLGKYLKIFGYGRERV